MKKLNYDFLNCLRYMPPLRHSVNGEEFDIRKSDVAKYISTRPEILQKIFTMAVQHEVIVYDKNTGKWKGANFTV